MSTLTDKEKKKVLISVFHPFPSYICAAKNPSFSLPIYFIFVLFYLVILQSLFAKIGKICKGILLGL